jgi:putative DNA primase/helicase
VNSSNYDDVLGQMRAAGLLVDALIVGTRQRCKVDGDREKRGWYHLHDWRGLIVGSYGIWHGNDPGSIKVELAKGAPMSSEERAALKARILADKKAEMAARQGQADRAAQRAAAMWRRLQADGDSEYLRRKCVQGHGVRFAESGTLVVPLLDVGGKIHGLQAIYPAGHPKRKRLGRDKDFWPAGLAKQGHFFLIGSPAVGAACLVCEGYATGATLYEATGLPVAVAFDAGNLVHVATALRARWRGLRVLLCADDDYLGKCAHCGGPTLTAAPACMHCGKEHGRMNAGLMGADTAALAVEGAVLRPVFAAERSLVDKGPTDFNDLHVIEGLQAVRAQVETRLSALKWVGGSRLAAAASSAGGGDGGGSGGLRSITTVEELHARFALVYEATDTVFDDQERKLVPLGSMRNICSSRQLHRWWMESADKRVVRLEEVGFDPTELDVTVKCNLWRGWPTTPRAGRCDRLLELGEYLCSEDKHGAELWRWLLRWLAYPIQNPGGKLKTAVVMHGPQGTGKNLFFEAVLEIYGFYGRLLGQDAVDDKFNDWSSRLLFGVADEMLARDEMYHSKNRVKVLITSDRIRVNPKNTAAYYERNHANFVFLSNEPQPMALERDDRRFGVIWTPQKHDQAFYNAVLAEVRAGGVAALHDHLLRVDMGDFGPATLPPVTQAKQDLIELGMDSSERFWVDWAAGYLPIPLTTAKSESIYAAYRLWCVAEGVGKPAQKNTCVGAWTKRPGVRKERPYHFENYSLTKRIQSMVLHPAGCAVPENITDLTASINRFNEALTEWRKRTTDMPQGNKSGADRPARATGTYGPDAADDDAAY